MVVALQVLFGVFGLAELSSNAFYVVSGREAALGRRQHGDLPPDCSDDVVRAKVRRMLVVGLLALACVVASLLTDEGRWLIAASGIIMLATVFEAASHRFYRAYIASAVTAVLFVVTILVV